MKHYRSLLLLPFVLTGCATTDMQGALDSLNGLGHSIGTSLAQAATPASPATRNSLLGTPLHNALRHNLSTDGRAPEWPKVVISNLSLCAPELPKQSNNFVLTWKSFSISGKTSGQVRSDGPTPPYSKLPSDPAMERWLMNQFGLYYVGSLLTLVGYDPNFTVDDRRFWIRNIKG